MADPVTIGLAVSAAATLAQGVTAFKGAQAERAQYEQERDAAKLQGEQEEVARRRRLQETLATQNALRASRGLSLDSAQAGAIRKRTVADADSDILNIRLNAGRQAARFGLAAQQAKLDGAGALIGSAGQAASGMFSAARYREQTGG